MTSSTIRPRLNVGGEGTRPACGGDGGARLKVGLRYVNKGSYSTIDNAEALAVGAEACGLESLWVAEHVVLPSQVSSTYPYSPDASFPDSPEAPIPDPLVWLTWLGARTKRILLGTGVLILPQRNPVILAKELATLDRATGGRVVLGVGVGWLREEFEAVGVPFASRGSLADEYIQAMRILWSEGEASYAGVAVSFAGVNCEPKPVRGAIPIVVGGHSSAAARRAGRLGDGWFPTPVARLPVLIDIMRSEARANGRDPSAIEITVGCTDPLDVEDLRRLGVHRVLFPAPTVAPDRIETSLKELLGGMSF